MSGWRDVVGRVRHRAAGRLWEHWLVDPIAWGNFIREVEEQLGTAISEDLHNRYDEWKKRGF